MNSEVLKIIMKYLCSYHQGLFNRTFSAPQKVSFVFWITVPSSPQDELLPRLFDNHFCVFLCFYYTHCIHLFSIAHFLTYMNKTLYVLGLSVVVGSFIHVVFCWIYSHSLLHISRYGFRISFVYIYQFNLCLM